MRIPHPTRFNAHAEDSTFTDSELQRTEGTIHVQAMFVAPMQNDRVRLRFFGGPSYFRLTMDGVSAIRYEQQYQPFGPGNVVDITRFDAVEIEDTGWGFHAGADVSVFFTRVFGVGGVVRFARGTIEVDDARLLADEPFDVKTGGLHLGGGLRLKF